MYDLLHFGGICSETKVSKKKAGADHSLKVQEFKLYSTKKKNQFSVLGQSWVAAGRGRQPSQCVSE